MKKENKENLYKCPSCKGSGFFNFSLEFGEKKINIKNIEDTYKCPTCSGSGYVDWIDNIFFNKKIIHFWKI